MGLADLHMHTTYSYDGTASVPAVLRRARQVGLDMIAITDHDEIRGALLAEQLASKYDLQVIPGVEITSAEGDLLALNIRKLVPAGLPLIETIQRVGALGGFCIAPHPMASGLSMKSLSAYSIRCALRLAETAQVLLGIETYNATSLDRLGNHAARILAERSDTAQTGSSDAHVLDAIGLGATIFAGENMDDLISALKQGTTRVQKGAEWSAIQIVSKWAASYVLSTPGRLLPGLAR